MNLDDVEQAHGEALRAWNTNAAVWDDHMGADGNDWHLMLVWPDTARMLDLRPGERVLDVACGNGLSARRMAAGGAEVVGIDASEAMLERASAYATEHDRSIEYRQVDVTDEAALLALGDQAYDAAVGNMALMDISDIGPLMRALPRLLRPGGRFVFSVLHPCFNNTGARVTEVAERHGEIQVQHSIKVSEYLRPIAERGIALAHQPEPHIYFFRPLHLLLQPAFEAGLMLDALAEPAFPEGYGEGSPAGNWNHYSQVPPILIGRLRRPGA